MPQTHMCASSHLHRDTPHICTRTSSWDREDFGRLAGPDFDLDAPFSVVCTVIDYRAVSAFPAWAPQESAAKIDQSYGLSELVTLH